MLICTYTYHYICSVCIRNCQNIHLNNIAFKFFTVEDRPRRDATTLLSVKRNHTISQTTTIYHSTTSFYYCFLSTTACTTMQNRASYQLLIPWLSLGHFSCLVPNLLVYISRLSYILSCIATLRITVEYIFVYSMHRRYARNMDLACYLICLHRAVYIMQASPEHASG